jgi:hypothetical protein
VAVLAGALLVSTVKPQAHAAVDAGGITWNPGQVKLIDDGSGNCFVQYFADVSTDTAAMLKSLDDEMTSESPDTNFPAETGVKDVKVKSVADSSATNTNLMFEGDLTSCPAASGNSAQTTALTLNPSRHANMSITELASFASNPKAINTLYGSQNLALPAWAKAAIAALVGSAVYISVSVLLTAAAVAAGVEIGAGTAAFSAFVLAAGCIGGAVSTAATLVIASGGGWQTGLSSAIAGCLTGAATAVLPIKAMGIQLGQWIKSTLIPVGALVGSDALSAAASAAIDLTPVETVLSTAATDLGA